MFVTLDETSFKLKTTQKSKFSLIRSRPCLDKVAKVERQISRSSQQSPWEELSILSTGLSQ